MSFAPDESSTDLWFERSNFVGGFLGAIAFGVYLTFFFGTFYCMLRERNDSRTRIANLIYITVVFVVTTVNLATGMRWNQMIWIDNRNYPGGPVAYINTQYSNWVNVLSNSAYTFNNFLADGLVLYRCLIIWQDNYLVLAFPTLMFLGSTALSIMTVFQSGKPNASLWTTVTVNFALPYWSLSISLNIIVTLLIVGRLMMLRRNISAALGEEHALKYTGVAAMLVESAALYTITSTIFIITYARNSYVQNLVLPVLCSVMPIAPLLILLRVSSGNGFSRQTTASMTSRMSFASPPSRSQLDYSFNDSHEDKTEGPSTGSSGALTLGGKESSRGSSHQNDEC